MEKFSKDGQTLGFSAKAGMGLTAGAIGPFCGTSADVALVRMCVDNRFINGENEFWLDETSKTVFPFCFLVFNATFWCYAFYGTQGNAQYSTKEHH